MLAACRAESAKAPCAAVAKEAGEEDEFLIIFPVVPSNNAILPSVALAGQCTSPVPSQTATRGLHGVPAPVTVTPSTDIWIIGLVGSVLSVFKPVTPTTAPLPPTQYSIPVSVEFTFRNLPALHW